MKAITLPLPIGAFVIEGMAFHVCHALRHSLAQDVLIGIGHPTLLRHSLQRTIERYTEYQRRHSDAPLPLDWYGALPFNSLAAIGDLVASVPYDASLLTPLEAQMQDPKATLMRFENVRKLDAPIPCKQVAAGTFWDYDEINGHVSHFPLTRAQIQSYHDLCRAMLAGGNDPDINADLLAHHPGNFILAKRYDHLRVGVIEWSQRTRGVQRVNRLWYVKFKRYFPEFWRSRSS